VEPPRVAYAPKRLHSLAEGTTADYVPAPVGLTTDFTRPLGGHPHDLPAVA